MRTKINPSQIRLGYFGVQTMRHFCLKFCVKL
nr:MAG TPA: Ca2+ regulator and membrane fusion protein [Caudoviricetes sp.]